MYGYQISKVLESLADDSLPMKHGTLYPVLRSLEREGQLESSLEPSDSGPQRRYYRITETGRTSLPLWHEAWAETRDFVDRFLALGPLPIEESLAGEEA